MTAKQDLGDSSKRGDLFAIGDLLQFGPVNARDGSAFDADEVRVRVGAVVVGGQLEPPNVIAQFRATGQAGVGEIVEVAKDRGFIEPRLHELFRNFCVTDRRLRRSQKPIGRDASGRTS